ncbi:MAG: hypothetical protein A2X94_05975 [Bdellovibrionales bacterium GWB1_55_8]|nr:MAG: hypothetical protein A2X94_05975 [Bdellovibrionales bacterium GWB1_55_8]
MIWRHLGILSTIGLVLLTTATHAASYTLFAYDGFLYDQVADYDQIVKRLVPGDELVFSNGDVQRIGQLVGTGNTTLIFELANDSEKLIRIPKGRDWAEFTETRYMEYMSSYQIGAEALRDQGVPIVKIHDQLAGEFTIVERIPGEMSLRDFLNRPPGAEGAQEMQDALVEFARKTAGFQEIGDFHPGQLFYHTGRKEWVLVDWSSAHLPLVPTSEDMLSRSRSLFVGRPEYRADFFFQFLKSAEAEPGNVIFTPVREEYSWIANLANRIHRAVTDERKSMIMKRATTPNLTDDGSRRRGCIFSILPGTI